MPDARVQVVPDAGHSPHLDQPAIIAEAVETFTKKTSSKRSYRQSGVQRSTQRSACGTVCHSLSG
jgi:hypothetical protein